MIMIQNNNNRKEGMYHRLDQIICWFFAHFVANIGANLKIDSSVGAKNKEEEHTHTYMDSFS